MRAYRGHLIHVSGAPRLAEATEHLVSHPDGLLVVDDAGRIVFSGSFAGVPPGAEVIDCRPGFLLPGFVDTHIHFPQTYCTNSPRRRSAAGLVGALHLSGRGTAGRSGVRRRGGAGILRAADQRGHDDGAGVRFGVSTRPGRVVRRIAAEWACGPSPGAASRPSDPASAGPLLTGEADAISADQEAEVQPVARRRHRRPRPPPCCMRRWCRGSRCR